MSAEDEGKLKGAKMGWMCQQSFLIENQFELLSITDKKRQNNP